MKINSDKEPSLSQTLGVTGLPTVFSVNDGKLTDRYIQWYFFVPLGDVFYDI